MNDAQEALSANTLFHTGEQAAQQRVGMREKMARIGPRAIRDHMLDEHRELFSRLPLLLVGSVSVDAGPQASVLAGAAGFVSSPGARSLRVDAVPAADDPLANALRCGASLGLLGMEAHTRRRNRMNGIVTALDRRGFSVGVQHSFGNCPKYIQARQALWQGEARAPSTAVQRAGRLSAAARALIASADTFYIASAHSATPPADVAAQGVDISHRGGKAGFVRIESGQADTLTVPDFSGNFVFNTIGNLLVNPEAGLLFIDYSSGDCVHLTVRTQIIWEGPEVESFAGAMRLLRFTLRQMLYRPAALPLSWGAAQYSPHLAQTGDWKGV